MLIVQISKCYVSYTYRYGTIRRAASAHEMVSFAFSSTSSIRQCPVLAAFYENVTTPRSADKYVSQCSIVASSRAAAGGQRKKLVDVQPTTHRQSHRHRSDRRRLCPATIRQPISPPSESAQGLQPYIPKLKTNPPVTEISSSSCT